MTALDRLWAGWRNDFVTGAAASPPPSASPVAAPPASAGSPESAESAVPAESAAEAGPAAGDCVFCRILSSGQPDTVTHVVWRHPAGGVVALLNAYPYTSGHLMVMPIRHIGAIEDLAAPEASAIWDGVADAVRAVKSAYRPDGVNLGANLGRAAGAGVPGHFHMHVLPRWLGDTNFMSTIADTRVLPEALSVTDERLRAAWPPAPSGPTFTVDGSTPADAIERPR